MGTDHDLDFSTSTAPESWFEAAAQAPKGDEQRPFVQPSVLPVLPVNNRIDLLMTALTSVAMSVVAGYAWYQMDSSGTLRTPWLAVALGVLIALAVRLGGGKGDRGSRAIVAGTFYSVTLVAVTCLAARHNWAVLYGDNGLVSFEEDLMRRIADPVTLVAWAIGGYATVKLSLLLGNRY